MTAHEAVKLVAGIAGAAGVIIGGAYSFYLMELHRGLPPDEAQDSAILRTFAIFGIVGAIAFVIWKFNQTDEPPPGPKGFFD